MQKTQTHSLGRELANSHDVSFPLWQKFERTIYYIYLPTSISTVVLESQRIYLSSEKWRVGFAEV